MRNNVKYPRTDETFGGWSGPNVASLKKISGLVNWNDVWNILYLCYFQERSVIKEILKMPSLDSLTEMTFETFFWISIWIVFKTYFITRKKFKRYFVFKGIKKSPSLDSSTEMTFKNVIYDNQYWHKVIFCRHESKNWVRG